MNGARFVHDRLELHGWQVEIADAQKVKGLAPLACKTDRIDAWVLAELRCVLAGLIPPELLIGADEADELVVGHGVCLLGELVVSSVTERASASLLDGSVDGGVEEVGGHVAARGRGQCCCEHELVSLRVSSHCPYDLNDHHDGYLTMIAANGDKLYGAYDYVLGGEGPAAITITGGTGRFADASGTVYMTYDIIPQFRQIPPCDPNTDIFGCLNPDVPWPWTAAITGTITY